jgi:hypothetical protein
MCSRSSIHLQKIFFLRSIRELQERERDVLIYLSRSPEVVAGHEG